MDNACAIGVFTWHGSYPTRYVVWPPADHRLQFFEDEKRWPQTKLDAYSQLAERVLEFVTTYEFPQTNVGLGQQKAAVLDWTRRLVKVRSLIRLAP